MKQVMNQNQEPHDYLTVSDCCGSDMDGEMEDVGICPRCLEHCEAVKEPIYWMNRPEPAQYSYAPTQKQIRKWIARVAFGRI